MLIRIFASYHKRMLSKGFYDVTGKTYVIV